MTELVECSLYGEDSKVRDEARAQIIRSGNAVEIKKIVDGLFSTLDLHRRRATRLLSDLQPHRARPAIVAQVEIFSREGWLVPDFLTEKIFTEGLSHAARLLNQMTVRGEREEALFMLYRSERNKVQRATICPASPPQLLGHILSDLHSSHQTLALVETLRRLDQLSEQTTDHKVELTKLLTSMLPPTLIPSILSKLQEATERENSESQLRLWLRLFAHLYPYEPTRSLWCDVELLSSLNLLTLISDPALLIPVLGQALSAFESHTGQLSEILVSIESGQRERGEEIINIIDDSILNTLSQHHDPVIRSTLARLLPPSHHILNTLTSDHDPRVAWSAKSALNGCFSVQQIHSRLGAHRRLASPSAKPPYGLRDFDEVPKVPRVRAALALCQARFDVNLGVAMRSAEAAGLSQIFVIGARSGSLTSARGAEHAIPIRWLSDARELISVARTEGYQLVAVQQTPDSEPYHTATYPPQPLFILGSEDAGLPDVLRVGADIAVEIPLYGVIDSLNVATAATCVIMHWRAHLNKVSES